MNDTAILQAALKALGFDPGLVDGQYGGKTRAAVKAFQAAKGLTVDGVAGKQTLDALKAVGANSAALKLSARPFAPWVEEAERHLGLAEVAGDPSNPTIMAWAAKLGTKTLGVAYRGDDVPWCGLFVAHCISASLSDEPLPAIAIRAKEWLKFGTGLAKPAYGSVGVFDRAGGGHVGFLVGEDGGALYVLGGNQANKVSVMRLRRDRLLAARWPVTVPLSLAALPQLSGGATSTNEA